MLKIPNFWHKEHSSSLLSLSLVPLGFLYGKITSRKANKSKGYKSKLPVICVGNITMGGTGKTPTSVALAKILKNEFHKNIAFLSRGYGGSITEPTRVLEEHKVSECGDEPLLLSKIAPTYISPDRGKGAILVESDNYINYNHMNDKEDISHKNTHKDSEIKNDVIILDDGMQNSTLQKDITLVVIDGNFGLGNNRVFPAGPLRETLKSAESRSSAFIIVGDDVNNTVNLIIQTIKEPIIIHAQITPVIEGNSNQNPNIHKNVVVFAGIGIPKKVFITAKQAGYNVVKTKSYGDHYNYTQSDLDKLVKIAENNNAHLLTTSKDYARLPQEFITTHNPLVLEVELTLDLQNKAKLVKLLKSVVK